MNFTIEDLQFGTIDVTHAPPIAKACNNYKNEYFEYTATVTGNVWNGLTNYNVIFEIVFLHQTDLTNVDTHGCHGQKCRNATLQHWCSSCNGDLDDQDDYNGDSGLCHLLASLFFPGGLYLVSIDDDNIVSNKLIESTQINDPKSTQIHVDEILRTCKVNNTCIIAAQKNLDDKTVTLTTLQSIIHVLETCGQSSDQVSQLQSDANIKFITSQLRSVAHDVSISETSVAYLIEHQDDVWEKYKFESLEDMQHQITEFVQGQQIDVLSKAKALLAV
jgi:hypothetical protein